MPSEVKPGGPQFRDEGVSLREYVDDYIDRMRIELDRRLKDLDTLEGERIDAAKILLSSKIDGVLAAFSEFKTNNSQSMEKLNEVRKQLNDQALTFMTKEVATAMMQSYVSTDRLEVRTSTLMPRIEATSIFITKDALAGTIASVVTRDMLEARSRQNLLTASAIATVIGVVFSVIGTFFPRYPMTPAPATPVIAVPQPPVSELPPK